MAVLRWISLAALGLCGCGGSSASTRPTQDEPSLIKRAAISWGLTAAGSSTDVYLSVTDETGRTTSHSLGRHDGECSVLSGRRSATGAITAVLCKRGDVGTELDVVPRPGMLIVLKLPYVAGAEPDPLAGEEAAHIAVPVGAKIETL